MGGWVVSWMEIKKINGKYHYSFVFTFYLFFLKNNMGSFYIGLCTYTLCEKYY